MQTTLIQQRQTAAFTAKETICHKLGWDANKYAQHQYQTGLEYLRLYTLDDAMAIATLERSKIFWNWWKNAWANRDETFIHNSTIFNWNYPVEMYKRMHKALTLAEELRPDAIVLGNSYRVMIGQVIDKVVNGE